MVPSPPTFPPIWIARSRVAGSVIVVSSVLLTSILPPPLIHTAPNVRRRDDGGYDPLCIGTTTSARMVRFTEPLGAQYGVRAICGKGGLPDEAIEPMHELGMVYLAIVGGAAALETTQIEEIEEVAWEELMPECLWRFRVRDFGPLTVGIDAHGNSLYRDVQTRATAKLEELYARL